MLRGLLAVQGSKVGRRHVKTLMRKMGIEAVYRSPSTTKPAPGHKIYPYLLRGPWRLCEFEPGLGHGYHVPSDGSRLRVSRRRAGLGDPPSFVMAVVDPHDGSGLLRRDLGGCLGSVMVGRKSSTPPTRVHDSPARRSTSLLASHDGPGMDTERGWQDDVFVERLWKSVKYERKCLPARLPERRPSRGIQSAAVWSFLQRTTTAPFNLLDDMTRDQAYCKLPPLRAAA